MVGWCSMGTFNDPWVRWKLSSSHLCLSKAQERFTAKSMRFVDTVPNIEKWCTSTPSQFSLRTAPQLYPPHGCATLCRTSTPGWSGIVHQASQELGLSQMMLGQAKHGIPKTRHHVGLAIPIFVALRIESFFSEAAGLTILDQHNQSGVPSKHVNVFLPPIHGRVFRNKTLGLP